MVDRNRIVTILIICALALAFAGVAVRSMPGEPEHKLGEGGPLTGNGHAEHHGTCPQSELPKFLRHKGIRCEEGSPNYFKGDESRLVPGTRRDSKLWIRNATRDGHGARIVAWGCNRKYRLRDHGPYPGIPGGGAHSEKNTGCNLNGHITQRRVGTGIDLHWKNNDHASSHTDGGGGGGGGGGGAF